MRSGNSALNIRWLPCKTLSMNAPFFLQESSNNVVMEPEEEDRKQYLEDFMVKVKKAKLQKVSL